MPIESKAQWARLKVGVMAILAIVILSVLIFLLTGREGFWSTKQTVYTYMGDSAALSPGGPVRLNGILVGSITDVSLSGLSEVNRIVKVEMRINEAYLSQIPVDSVASLGAENLLGSKYINIKRGQSLQMIRPGAEIPALEASDIDAIVQKGNAMMANLQGSLKRIDTIIAMIEKGQGTIGKLISDDTLHTKVVNVIDEVQKIAKQITSGQGTVGKLLSDEALYTDIRKSLGRVDNLLEGLQQGQGSAGKLLKDPGLYDDTRKSIAEVRTLLADLNAGKGSAGKLLKSEELHNQVAVTLKKLDTTIDKLNAGQGTLGQLLVNPALYDNLNGTTAEMKGLMKDFRANPKKFLRIKLALF